MHHLRRLFVLISLALGCTGQPSVSPDITGGLEVRRLRQDPYSFAYSSGLNDSTRAVVRDAAAWATIWGAIHRHSSLPPLPAVDFTRDMVVVVALGTRPSGGYSIYVDSAHAVANGGTEVVVHKVNLGAGCGATAALTQPVDIALLPRRDGQVTFRDRTTAPPCK
jgi:hypothetical protein